MDWKMLLVVFAAVFVAELGDKTQIATVLFATDKEVSKMTVFIGAALALTATSAIGVFAGSLLADYLNKELLQTIAGVSFIAIGVLTLWHVYVA